MKKINKCLMMTLFAISFAMIVFPQSTRGLLSPYPGDPIFTKSAINLNHMNKMGDAIDFNAPMILGADYLKQMQADITEDNAGNGTGVGETPDDPEDGGWDWRVTSPPAPFFHTTAASPKNIYGATALGLYNSYLETNDPTYFTALTDAANIMVGDVEIRSGADMVFLMLYNELPSVVGTAYEDAAKAKYDGRITTYGTATALAEYIRDVRAGQGYENGIIGWDVGIYAVIAQMLYDRFGGTYNTDADDIAEVLWQDSFNDTPGYFDVVDDAGWDPTYSNYNYYWYTLGITGLIDAFRASDTHTSDIPLLVGQLQNSQYPNSGAFSYSYGANLDDEDWQSTAYTVITLNDLNSTTYETEINHAAYFIASTQDVSGGWLYSTDNHYPEIGGENTRALYFGNAPLEVWVDDDYTSTSSGGHLWGYDAFSTIQEGIEACTDGGQVNVAAGTYEEQLTIDGKTLTIQGTDVNSTFINSPITLATTFTTSSAKKCVVGVINDGNLTLDGFTVDGLGRGNANVQFIGIGFRNSGGTVQNCKVLNIMDTPFSGAQHGVAIYSYNDDATARTINVLNNEITGFQKNAMALNASDSNPLTVGVVGNTITGAGATSVTAQNGIQVSGDIVIGNINNNTVNGIEWIYPGSGTAWVATSILNFYADLDIYENIVNDGHTGLYNIDGSSNIYDNILNIVNNGSYAYGLIATDPPSAVPSPFDQPENENKIKYNPEALTSVLIDGNTVTFSGPDNTDTYGIEADAGYGPDDLAILATNNSVSGFGVGFGVYLCESGCDVGVFTSLDFNHNNILNNTIGFETNLVTPVMAELNWWGTAIESEIQALINGPLDYDPWIGKAEMVNVTQLTPTIYDFPTAGAKMEFTTLPSGGGDVTVSRYNEAPTPFPSGYENVGMWLDISSTMPNYSFNVTVYVDVFGIPDFDASTTVMYYNTSSSSWVAIPGGIYTASDPLFGGHPSYSFVTNHFTPFTFINTPATAKNVYLSTSNTVIGGTIYPNTDWGVTSYEGTLGDDWDFTTPVSLYIVPEVGSQFGATTITVQWDNTVYNYVGVDKTGGIYDNAAYFFNTLPSANQVIIDAGRYDNLNFTIGAGQYIAKIEFNLIKPGYNPISFTALDFRFFDGLGGQLGVFVTGNNAQVKSYLGDVASNTSTLTGDGLVDFYDLSPWSISYWSGVGGFGMANYKVKYDVGPTSTNNVYGIPAVDGKIQFEDFVIFAMSYGLSASNVYPKIEAEPTTPVNLQLGEPMIAGSQTRIPLFVSGGVQNVRAMSLSFTGQFGKLVSVEKGTLLTDIINPVIVMNNVEGNQVYVDMAVFGAEEVGINTEGEVLTLVFEGEAEISLSSANVRNILNGEMVVNISGTEGLVPAEYALMQNYPNPFNPTTTINFELPIQTMVEINVYNALGEKVETLINEIKNAGKHNVKFNAGGYSSGIYFYQIKANDFVSVKKMILMK